MVRFTRPKPILAVAALCSTAFACCHVQAQSGTRSAPTRTYSAPAYNAPAYSSPSYNAPPAPRQSMSTQVVPMQVKQAAPALQGYCPVCVIEMKKWMRGNPSIQAQYDGKTYFFPGEDQRQKFLANPAKYAPALGGDCAVCLVNMNKKMPGSVQHTALHNNRLFMFPNAEIKQKFMADPDKYADADLALGGHCAVCKVEMKQAVPGKSDFSTVHGGMRYQFPSDKQRSMFIANPAKYSVAPTAMGAGGSSTNGSGTR